MSLTKFVGDAAVRDRIDETFPNQGQRPTADLQAGWQTNNYTLVGTAFDYLFRFWLRKEAADYTDRQWVAETALDLTELQFPDRVEEVEEVISRAKQNRTEFLETGELSRPLVESSLDLARVDWIYRSGRYPEDLGEYDSDDILDCLRLMEILNDTAWFDDIGHTTLNPAFGVGSWLVGGADADTIIDGCLLDLKTTSKSTFKVDYWRQLVGYLTLADIHDTLQDGFYEQFGGLGVPTDPLPEIEEFGIYYARHGEVVTIDASVVYGDSSYPEFREWFVQKALENYPPDNEAVGEVVLSEFFAN